jgi:hypothetical protein
VARPSVSEGDNKSRLALASLMAMYGSEAGGDAAPIPRGESDGRRKSSVSPQSRRPSAVAASQQDNIRRPSLNAAPVEDEALTSAPPRRSLHAVGSSPALLGGGAPASPPGRDADARRPSRVGGEAIPPRIDTSASPPPSRRNSVSRSPVSSQDGGVLPGVSPNNGRRSSAVAVPLKAWEKGGGVESDKESRDPASRSPSVEAPPPLRRPSVAAPPGDGKARRPSISPTGAGRVSGESSSPQAEPVLAVSRRSSVATALIMAGINSQDPGDKLPMKLSDISAHSPNGRGGSVSSGLGLSPPPGEPTPAEGPAHRRPSSVMRSATSPVDLNRRRSSVSSPPR